MQLYSAKLLFVEEYHFKMTSYRGQAGLRFQGQTKEQRTQRNTNFSDLLCKTKCSVGELSVIHNHPVTTFLITWARFESASL